MGSWDVWLIGSCVDVLIGSVGDPDGARLLTELSRAVASAMKSMGQILLSEAMNRGLG